MFLRKTIVSAAALATATVFSAASWADGTIKIGDINSYTRLPGHTVPYKRGAQLAIEHINAKRGGRGTKLQRGSLDDNCKPG